MDSVVNKHLPKQDTFCRVNKNYGDNTFSVLHTDGCGTKSILACNWYDKYGDTSGFKNVVEDSINMNLNDIACVGIRSYDVIDIVTTLNIHSKYATNEILDTIIGHTNDYISFLNNNYFMNIRNCGGETATVDILTNKVIIDHTVHARSLLENLLTLDIRAGLDIVGVASFNDNNCGVASNGISAILQRCKYIGIDDGLEKSLLDPTINLSDLLSNINQRFEVYGMIHNTGGGLSKSLKFSAGLNFIKDNLFKTPFFTEFNMPSDLNMGHLVEIYCRPENSDNLVTAIEGYGYQAKIIGRTEDKDLSSSLVL